MPIYNNIKIKPLGLILLIVSLGLFSGCGGSGSSSDDGSVEDHSQTPSTAQLIGRISTDSANVKRAHSRKIDTKIALAGVTISINNQNTTTDNDGFFVLPNIDIPTMKRWVVDVQKAGYIATQTIVELDNDQESYSIDVLMTLPDISTTADLRQPQTITLNEDQLSISLPANAVSGGGNNATVSLTYGDPNSTRGKAIFPGDYSATNDISTTPNIILESIGFMDISVTDENGNDLSVLSAPASITLRLPAMYQTGGAKEGDINAGDTIEWWSYNEDQGTWLREDADPSTNTMDNANITDVEGVLFANAQVTHFSWWNVDRPIEEHACITVKVIDKNGQPLKSFAVTAEGVSFDSNSTALTNAEGFVSLTVKRTTNLATPETFRLFASVGSVEFLYDVTSITEGDVDTDILNSPSQSGSTIIENTGSCVLLNNPIQPFYAGTIIGTVKNPSGIAIPGTTVYNSLGDSVITDDNGNYSFDVPFLNPIFILIPGVFSEQIVTNESTPTVTVNIVLGNQAPIINEIALNPTSNIQPGQTVQLTANATDPENDALTYTWSASKGVLVTSSGKTISWTAPNENSGSADLGVVIKDTANNETISTRVVSWQNDANNDKDFFVRAKRSIFTENGEIEGITVILHGVDGKSIEQELTTDANGIANFGVINRERVTFTVIEPYQENDSTQYNISTSVDILTTPIPYWIEAGDSVFNTFNCIEEDQQTTIQAKFINIPDDVKSIYVAPTFLQSIPPEENKVVSINLCADLLSNKNHYFVATGFNTDDIYNSPMVAHSQAISTQSGDDVFIFDMSKRPVTFPYINNTNSPVYLYITSLTEFLKPLTANLHPENNTISLFDFTYDRYFFSANTDEVNDGDDLDDDSSSLYVSYDQTWIEDELPENVVIDIPEFSADNIVMNEPEGRFSWSLTNSESVDSLTITQKYYNATWEVTLPPSITSIQLPQLPEAFDDIIDPNNLEKQTLELLNFNNYQGYDALIERFIDIDLGSNTDEFIFFENQNSVTYQVKDIETPSKDAK